MKIEECRILKIKILYLIVFLLKDSDAITLEPNEGNYHSISAVDGPAAFLDLLAPPYDHHDNTRVCQYYTEISPSQLINEELPITNCVGDICYLMEIPEPSHDHAKYRGPIISVSD
jgi:cysteamine dioxygenase